LDTVLSWQAGAQGDAGLRFGVFPLLRPPRPLAREFWNVETREP